MRTATPMATRNMCGVSWLIALESRPWPRRAPSCGGDCQLPSRGSVCWAWSLSATRHFGRHGASAVEERRHEGTKKAATRARRARRLRRKNPKTIVKPGEDRNVEKYDLVVLGTGTAGSGVATRCALARWRVAIVESREPGGTCALRGCDPKKVLVGAAEVVDAFNRLRG